MNIFLDPKKALEALKSWLGVITVFTAAGYTLFEYTEHKQSVRVERALSYIEHYRDSNTTEAKLGLNQLLADKQPQLSEILKRDYKNSADVQLAYNDFILLLTRKPDTQRNIEIAFSFFEEAAICVQRELCDKEVILSFFLNDAKSLFNSFYPYVCQLREQWNNNTVYLELEQFYVKPKDSICN